MIEISIIIASYNYSKFLSNRINSFLEMKIPGVEIIVIDDASTDGSRGVLNEFRHKKEVKIVELDKNVGWVRASNIGLASAQGKLVMFANCDDVCNPNILEHLSRPFEDHKLCVTFCKSFLIDSTGKVIGLDINGRSRKFQTSARNGLILSQTMSELLGESCVIPNLSAALFNRQRLLEVGGFDENYKVCADWDVFFKLSRNFDFYYISEPLNMFRQHKDSIREKTSQLTFLLEITNVVFTNVITLPFIKRHFLRTKRIEFLFVKVFRRELDLFIFFQILSKIKLSKFLIVVYLIIGIIFLPFTFVLKTIKKLI
jgi:GT2 family glycosyltransferase